MIKKYIQDLVLAILLIAIFLVIIILSAFPDVSLPSSTYRFMIRNSPSSDTGYIRDFMFDYNFKSDNGNLSFMFFANKQDLGRISINLPKELNVSTFIVKEEGKDMSSSCYTTSGNYSSGISCENIFGNKSLDVLLKLKGKEFYPNGIFIFNFPSEDTTLSYNDETYSYEFLKFDLGDYRCSEKCFTEEVYSNLTYNSNKESFRIYLLPEGVRVGRWYSFVISAYNFNKERLFAIFLALGISGLSGSLFFFLSLILNKNKS